MNGILLVDMSNLVFSSCLDYHAKTKEQFDMKLLRNVVLERLSNEKKKHQKTFPELVLCFDGRRYWRRSVFPHYKGKRGEEREKSTFDWNSFFPLYEQLKEELRENFPLRCIEVEGAEADDLIATICKVYGPHRDICISSSDKDFLQIQLNICPRIKQWSPYHKKFLTPKNTEYDLFAHVVKGDTGDGIPNIFSDDDTFMVKGKRQKPIRDTSMVEWGKYGLANPEKFCRSALDLERLQRNLTLIDFRKIPDDLTDKIVTAFEDAKEVKGKLFNYMVQNRLTRLMTDGHF